MAVTASSPSLAICEDLHIELADYARTGLRVGIWASSGRGKSFGVGVLCEELLAAGIPVVALDPEGELHTLRERFRVLVLGGDHADLPLPSGDQAATLALARALDEGIGLVLDLSDRPTSRSQQEAAYPFLERLWVLLSERRSPAALVVEEVHLFAPQSGSSLTSDILHRFAKQGRKRGVLLVAASQRTQAVSKEFMSQLNFQAIGGFEIERDYDAVKAIVDGHPFEELRRLPVGEFFFASLGRFSTWRPRHTAHGGDAPSFSGAGEAAPRTDAKLGTLIGELREAFAREAESAQAPDPTGPLRAEIRRLTLRLEQAEEARRSAEAETAQLRVALQVAGVVKVVVQNEVVLTAAPPAASPAVSPLPLLPSPAPRASTLPSVPSGPPLLHPPPAPPVLHALPVQPIPDDAAGAAPAPHIASVQTTARPAAPSLRDLGIAVARLVELPGVKVLLIDARKRARLRSPRSVTLVVPAAKLLAGGGALSPEELAARTGSRSQIAVRRAVHVLDALVAAGFARVRDGRHVLDEATLLRAVQVR